MTSSNEVNTIEDNNTDGSRRVTRFNFWSYLLRPRKMIPTSARTMPLAWLYLQPPPFHSINRDNCFAPLQSHQFTFAHTDLSREANTDKSEKMSASCVWVPCPLSLVQVPHQEILLRARIEGNLVLAGAYIESHNDGEAYADSHPSRQNKDAKILHGPNSTRRDCSNTCHGGLRRPTSGCAVGCSSL